MNYYVVAMQVELKNVLPNLKLISSKPYPIYQDGSNTAILSGIGKVNAGSATQYLVTKFQPKKIINFGIVGSFDKNLKIAQVVEVNQTISWDTDLTTFGYTKGQMAGNNSLPIYPLDTDSQLAGVKCVSGDTFLDKLEVLNKVITDFGDGKQNLLIVDMELSAIAHICHINNVLLQSYKAISDYANSESKEQVKIDSPNLYANLKSMFLK